MRGFEHDFLRILNTYINGAIFSKYDLILSLFSPKLSFDRHSNRIVQKYKELKKNANSYESHLPYTGVQIKPYTGKNPYVLAMIRYLKENLKEDLIGAYVHGSIATCEEIAFSDYDALVILKDEIFSSSKRVTDVAFKLYSASEQMFNFDPIQHHGWFVLAESHLNFYPEYFFPLELYPYANSLFDDMGLELKIGILNSNQKKKEVFYSLSNGIIKKIKKKNYPRNVYQLKAFLSQFMLIPAVYLQLREGKGIFKKYSFEAARTDFSEDLWSIMDDVTSLRQRWSYDLPNIKRKFLCESRQLTRLIAQRCAPRIPGEIKKTLSEKFYQRMMNLVLSMHGKFQ